MIHAADIRGMLRITTGALDDEIELNIEAAVEDLKRVGVDPAYLEADTTPPLVVHAVVCWCKAHMGFDNDEAPRFMESYRACAIDLAYAHGSSSSS